MNYKGYKELGCYSKAGDPRIFLSALAKKIPLHEKFLFPAPVIDCSRSISRNMAERYGSFTFTDTRNFFIIARRSCTETMEQLASAFDEKYITEEGFKAGEGKCELVFKLINGYIAYLDTSKKQGLQQSNPIPNSELPIPLYHEV